MNCPPTAATRADTDGVNDYDERDVLKTSPLSADAAAFQSVTVIPVADVGVNRDYEIVFSVDGKSIERQHVSVAEPTSGHAKVLSPWLTAVTASLENDGLTATRQITWHPANLPTGSQLHILRLDRLDDRPAVFRAGGTTGPIMRFLPLKAMRVRSAGQTGNFVSAALGNNTGDVVMPVVVDGNDQGTSITCDIFIGGVVLTVVCSAGRCCRDHIWSSSGPSCFTFTRPGTPDRTASPADFCTGNRHAVDPSGEAVLLGPDPSFAFIVLPF